MRKLIVYLGLFFSIAGAAIPSPKPAAPDPDPPPVAVVTIEKTAEPALRGGIEPDLKAELSKLDQFITTAVPKAKPAPSAPDYGCFVYPVRFRGYENGQAKFYTGSAVSIGSGRFLTTAHGVDGLAPGYVVEFQIGENWHKATSVRVERKADILEAGIDRTDVAGVPVRRQEFGEPVTLYGLTGRKAMKGRAYSDLVGLEPDEPGVHSGDSGGGVFGNDGALVGLVSGYGQFDHRCVEVSRLNEPSPPPSVSAKPSPAIVAPQQYAPAPTGTVCQNGQCWRTSSPAVTCRNGKCWKR